MPRIRLTAKLVLSLPAPAKGNVIFFDTPNERGLDCTPGFGLRVTAAGFRAYVLNYSIAGRERRMTLGSPPAWSLLAARTRAAELRRDIDQGIDPLTDATALREAPTVRDLVERYGSKFCRRAGRTRGANIPASSIARSCRRSAP